MQPIPEINVNLAQQTCPTWCVSGVVRSKHSDKCPNAPILIPCPIPRSVTFEVRIGECKQVGCVGDTRKYGHAHDCPARPIRVTCSISGKTWEESKVASVDAEEGLDDGKRWMMAAQVCRDRWAVVKALVTGQPWPDPFESGGPKWRPELFTQRAAVFAALADMVRHEDGVFAAQVALGKAASAHGFGDVHGISSDPSDRPSADFLVAYVAHLIEQVGVLS